MSLLKYPHYAISLHNSLKFMEFLKTKQIMLKTAIIYTVLTELDTINC